MEQFLTLLKTSIIYFYFPIDKKLLAHDGAFFIIMPADN